MQLKLQIIKRKFKSCLSFGEGAFELSVPHPGFCDFVLEVVQFVLELLVLRSLGVYLLLEFGLLQRQEVVLLVQRRVQLLKQIKAFQ